MDDINKNVIDRLKKFKEESKNWYGSPYVIGIHKDGTEFNLEDIDTTSNIKKILDNDGFRIQGLDMKDTEIIVPGEHHVRLSCGILNKPILDSGCSIIAEIDTKKELEPMEIDILDSIDNSLTELLCEDATYNYLCKKTVSMGIMSKLGDNIRDAFKETVEHELKDIYDYVEFKD